MIPTYHNPVLLDACIDALAIQPSGTYVDLTFGGGGHSKALLNQLGPKGRLFAFDQDVDAQENRIDDQRFTLIASNFRHLKAQLRFYGCKKVDGVLADFGVSSHQFDTASRGFSTRFDAPLDMRMNNQSGVTAAEVVNTYSADDLARLLRTYADLKNAFAIAKAIVQGRANTSIDTTFELIEAISSAIYVPKRNQQLAQVFQALRIEVNKELEAIESMLPQLIEVVALHGRIALMSYHSLEDRLVKNFIRSSRLDGEVQKDFFGNPQLYFKKIGKPIEASEEEVSMNSRARSAVLRVAERVEPKTMTS